jgi:metallo-beta-lactamase class B
MHLMISMIVLGSALVSAQSPYLSPAQRARFHGSDSEPVEPFRIVGNIYYVGAKSLASYLMTTPQGHILLDTGTNEMHSVIRANVEKLGFKLQDIKYLLSSHAHFDHMQGHALMKKATGAQVVALGGDAVAIESGKDTSALGDEGWTPVKVERVVNDGDTISLGGMTLRAVWTGGHTQGATMWMTTVQEKGRTFSVAFRGGEIPNAGVPLFNNPRHPTVVADTQRTLRVLKASTPPDLFLHNHANRSDKVIDPLINPKCTSCMDAAGFKKMVADAEANFQNMLKEAEAEEQERLQYIRGREKTSGR